MQHNTSRRGNALFMVLIAVVLFAALIYALNIGWKSSATNSLSSREQARLYAGEIVQFGNNLRTVIDRMVLVEGISDSNAGGNGLLFSATDAHADYGAAGAQPATEIFNLSGGKVTYQTPPQEACLSACSYEFSGQYTVTGVGSNANPEIVMLVINVSQTVCEAANSLLDMGWSSVPAGGALTLTRFDGTAYGGTDAVTLTGAGNVFVGKRAFCYRESASGLRYIYLQVIRSR